VLRLAQLFSAIPPATASSCNSTRRN